MDQELFDWLTKDLRVDSDAATVWALASTPSITDADHLPLGVLEMLESSGILAAHGYEIKRAPEEKYDIPHCDNCAKEIPGMAFIRKDKIFCDVECANDWTERKR